jgi:hypothetical protein
MLWCQTLEQDKRYLMGNAHSLSIIYVFIR